MHFGDITASYLELELRSGCAVITQWSNAVMCYSNTSRTVSRSSGKNELPVLFSHPWPRVTAASPLDLWSLPATHLSEAELPCSASISAGDTGEPQGNAAPIVPPEKTNIQLHVQLHS